MLYIAVQMPVVRELNSRSIGVTPQILSTDVISSMTTYISDRIAGARSCLGLFLGPPHCDVMGARAVPECAHMRCVALLHFVNCAFLMSSTRTLHLRHQSAPGDA